jgi:hypothetical protein
MVMADPNSLVKPSEKLSGDVEPALADYLQLPSSERLANNLARAINDQLEWTYVYYSRVDTTRLMGAKDLGDFRRALFLQCPDLKTMWDLSDAAKHRFLTRPSSPPRTTLESTAAFIDGGGDLLLAATNRPFREAAERAVEFWRKWKD